MSGFAGFDRSDYPGPKVMRWFRENTNIKWCGYYLAPAPSHQDMSWMNAEDGDLEGWGFAPIYVGRQVLGPGSRLVSGLQGKVDGASACGLMVQAGFDRGSVVYLDLENGPPFGGIQQDYVGEWCDGVRANGFSPGVYCSFLIAPQLARLRPDTKIWVFHVRTVQMHRVLGENFPTPEPKTSGFAGASIWQHDDEAVVECPAMLGGRIVVDLDSADSEDPSVGDQ